MSTKCKGCGRKLKSAESIRRGYGQKCFKEATEDQQSAHRQHMDRIKGVVSSITMQPVAAYIVHADLLALWILEPKYETLIAKLPVGRLEIRVYADFVTYQAEASDNRQTLVDMVNDVELFTRIKNELKKPQAGVTPISIQQEMGLAV